MTGGWTRNDETERNDAGATVYFLSLVDMTFNSTKIHDHCIDIARHGAAFSDRAGV
jgi:hypothetical protein